MKKMLSILLAVVFIFSAVPMSGVADLVGNIDFSFLSLKANAASTSDLVFTLSSDGNSYSVTDCYEYASGTLVIPATYYSKPVTSIGDYAFYNCAGLTNVTIPDGVTSIGYDAFEDCTGLTSVNIPDSVTSIDGGAFYGCTELTSIAIPDGVTSIGSWAFYNCTRLANIEIPDSVTSIGRDAFTNTAYHNNENNWESDVLYIGNHLIKTKPFKISTCEVKAGTKTIADYAFEKCSELTGITISNSVTNIGDGAFCGCAGIKSITMPDSITSIGEATFFLCTELTSLAIPNGVTSIGESAFCKCTKLTSVEIPNSVTSIAEDAFKNCADDLTIHCVQNSTAHQYAVENDIKFVLSDEWQYKDTVLSLGKATNGDGCVKVTWSAVTGAEGYIVYRKADSDKSWTALETVTTTSYADTSVTSGKKYTYMVRAYCGDVKGKYNSTGISVYYLAQPDVKVVNQNGGVKISWGKVNEAKSYNVYRKADTATKWTKVATVTTNYYTDKNVSSGFNYAYCVKAMNGNYASAYNTKGVVTKYLAQPTVKAANKNGSVKASWAKIAGTKSYIVYRKAGSATKWSKVATVTTNYYTDKSVKSGTNYTYTVKAVNGSYVSAYNTKGVVTRYLAQPTLGTPVSAKAGITVKWGKVTGANGYIVYRKTGSGEWVKLATVKGNTTVSYVDKSAKKGTTYTYTVKAYYGSYYSAYNTKGVTIKDKY